MGAGDIWDISVLFSQFRGKPKIALKIVLENEEIFMK